jgi:hypothetical protein
MQAVSRRRISRSFVVVAQAARAWQRKERSGGLAICDVTRVSEDCPAPPMSSGVLVSGSQIPRRGAHKAEIVAAG